MGHFIGYRCSICKTEYSPEEVTYNCPKDQGNLDVVLDTAQVHKKLGPGGVPAGGEASLWRYLPLLPAVFAAIHFAWGLGFLAGVARILIPPEKPKQ